MRKNHNCQATVQQEISVSAHDQTMRHYKILAYVKKQKLKQQAKRWVLTGTEQRRKISHMRTCLHLVSRRNKTLTIITKTKYIAEILLNDQNK